MMPSDSQAGAPVEVTMVRDDLRGYPEFDLPSGYRMRTYREGDRETWTAVHVAADPFFATIPDLFDQEYGHALDALADRMYFLETPDSEPVGSITAWWEHKDDRPGGRGRIHWVVIHPAFQRRGLAKPMMTHAMRRLAQSYTSAMRGTETGLTWAVKVYLDFGFLPDPDELRRPDIVQGWRHVQQALGHPALARTLDALDRNT